MLMKHFFQVNQQPNGFYSLFVVGNPDLVGPYNTWAQKIYNLTAEEIGQLLGGN
jgi:hypothetical protein